MANTAEATLYMNSERICREYREAKNKKQQIGILADQNLCGKSEIIKILIEAGEDMSCMEPKKGEGKAEGGTQRTSPGGGAGSVICEAGSY